MLGKIPIFIWADSTICPRYTYKNIQEISKLQTILNRSISTLCFPWKKSTYRLKMTLLRTVCMLQQKFVPSAIAALNKLPCRHSMFLCCISCENLNSKSKSIYSSLCLTPLYDSRLFTPPSGLTVLNRKKKVAFKHSRTSLCTNKFISSMLSGIACQVSSLSKSDNRFYLVYWI